MNPLWGVLLGQTIGALNLREGGGAYENGMPARLHCETCVLFRS